MNLRIPNLIIAYKTKLGHLTLTVHYASIKSVMSSEVFLFDWQVYQIQPMSKQRLS
jgi:hypothetical protein